MKERGGSMHSPKHLATFYSFFLNACMESNLTI